MPELSEYLTVWNMLAVAGVLLVLLWAASRIPLSYNVRNLTVRWKTTLMTALAFTAVIALLTVMMAFVNGMSRITQASGQPGNVIVLSDGATDEVLSNLTIGDLGEIENLHEVERANGRPLASRETFLIANQPEANHTAGQRKRRLLQMRGIEDPSLTSAVHGVELLPGGHWFSGAGVRKATDGAKSAPMIEAVLGEGVAHELARDRTADQREKAKNRDRLDVGDTFVVRDRIWIVVGILNSTGLTFNSEIWAKRSLMASLFGKDTCTTLVLRTPDAEAAQRLKHFLATDYKKVALTAQVETEYYESLSQTNAQFSYAIGFLAMVMSIGCIFGVMNTMFAAVSQRVGDIGVLRLLGYARWHILVSFLLESLVIALIGGLLGCALGSLCDGWRATSILTNSGGGGKSVVLQLVLSARIVAISILLTLSMGLLGGLLPSLSAMRLKPLEALK